MSDSHTVPIPYVDRDVSWVYFNHRILKEAEREDIPLLERVAFLGIYSNNLDEFFRVRMATLSRIAGLKGTGMREESQHARDLFNRISAMDAGLAEE